MGRRSVTDAEQLQRLVDAIDLVLEYNHPPRIAHLMMVVEELKPNHLGWGSWLAFEGYKNYPPNLQTDGDRPNEKESPNTGV